MSIPIGSIKKYTGDGQWDNPSICIIASLPSDDSAYKVYRLTSDNLVEHERYIDEQYLVDASNDEINTIRERTPLFAFTIGGNNTLHRVLNDGRIVDEFYYPILYDAYPKEDLQAVIAKLLAGIAKIA